MKNLAGKKLTLQMSEITVHKSMGHFLRIPENLGIGKIWIFEFHGGEG
jgi:hypothetical protein